MRPFKLFAAASLLLAAWSSVQAADKSIRGLKAGMTVPEALQSLSADLRQGAKVRPVFEDPELSGLIDGPDDPMLKTFTVRSGDKACEGFFERTRECLRLQATGWGAPTSRGRLYLIRLDQFFGQPLDFDAFTQRAKEAYGNPVVSIGPTGGTGKERHDWVNWLWSDEALTQTSEVRKWAESGFPRGPADVKFAAPVLYMRVYLRGGQVRGMEAVLLEPTLLREFRSEHDIWLKRNEDDRARKAREGAGKVQLR